MIQPITVLKPVASSKLAPHIDKQMKHRSKAEDVLITKIIKMLLLTLGLICSQFVQGTVLIRNAAELKSFSKGEEEHLEKVSSRMLFQLVINELQAY